jgi:hypothetical protein
MVSVLSRVAVAQRSAQSCGRQDLYRRDVGNELDASARKRVLQLLVGVPGAHDLPGVIAAHALSVCNSGRRRPNS